jgi:hypothetical protein
MSYTILVTEKKAGSSYGYSDGTTEPVVIERYSQTLDSLDLQKIICAVNGITPFPKEGVQMAAPTPTPAAIEKMVVEAVQQATRKTKARA